jgi:hypothetical protein
MANIVNQLRGKKNSLKEMAKVGLLNEEEKTFLIEIGIIRDETRK